MKSIMIVLMASLVILGSFSMIKGGQAEDCTFEDYESASITHNRNILEDEVYSGMIALTLTLPDLQIVEDEVEVSGNKFIIKGTILNNWTGSVPEFNITLFCSKGMYGTEEMIGETVVGPLGPMNTTEVIFEYSAPESDFYGFDLKIDSSKSIKERNEDNNWISRGTHTDDIEVLNSYLLYVILAMVLLLLIIITFVIRIIYKNKRIRRMEIDDRSKNFDKKYVHPGIMMQRERIKDRYPNKVYQHNGKTNRNNTSSMQKQRYGRYGKK